MAIDVERGSIVVNGGPRPGQPETFVAPDDSEQQERLRRAQVAMSTLQVRSAVRAAELAERRLEEADGELRSARAAVQARIDSVRDTHRRRWDAELEAARVDAARLVEVARVKAAAARFEAAQRAAHDDAPPEPEPEPEPEPPRVDDTTELRFPEPDAAKSAPLTAEVTPVVPPPAAASNPQFVIDAATLSQAVAAGVAAALTQTRGVRWAQPPVVHEPRRRSVSESVLHLDVLLPVVAAAVVFLVLWAWVG